MGAVVVASFTSGETGRGLGAVAASSTVGAGSVGRASGEEPHPAISIGTATAIAIERGTERLGLILDMGRFSRFCTGAHLLSHFSRGA